MAKDCMQAGSLGTLLSVLGPERGMAYVSAHGLAVPMPVGSPDGLRQRQSPAFAAAVSR